MSSNRPPTLEEYQPYVEEVKERNPMVNYAFGIGGLALAAMALNFKTRGTKFQPSLYLIHTRLVVQGTVLTLFGGSMLWGIVKNYKKQQEHAQRIANEDKS